MARAIDADYLMERLNRKKAGPANKRYTEGFNDCLMRVRSMVHSMPTLTQPNEPLTLEELRGMDGEPVWVKDVRHWALIDIGKGGKWDGVPFAIWVENGVRFYYNILVRNLLCYRRPPEGEDDK